MESIIEDLRKDEDGIKKGLELARCAEEAERYKDMCAVMRMVVDLKFAKGEDLNAEERTLLSVGYKNLVGNGRGSYRTMKHGDSKSNILAQKYIDVIAKETTSICVEVLDILEKKLIPQAKSLLQKEDASADQSCIFYLKTAGDYYRYRAEFDKEGGFAEKARDTYLEGSKLAHEHLKPTDPIRLGLALNLSVCYYETLDEPKEACKLAKQAFDEAIAKLDALEESDYKDATLIMQLLRDNLTLWTSSDKDVEQEEIDEVEP